MRTDAMGFSTKVTYLGPGKGYGVRLFRDQTIISEGRGSDRLEAGRVLRGLLRMAAKCGYPSPMASASRSRRYI